MHVHSIAKCGSHDLNSFRAIHKALHRNNQSHDIVVSKIVRWIDCWTLIEEVRIIPPKVEYLTGWKFLEGRYHICLYHKNNTIMNAHRTSIPYWELSNFVHYKSFTTWPQYCDWFESPDHRRETTRWSSILPWALSLSLSCTPNTLLVMSIFIHSI